MAGTSPATTGPAGCCCHVGAHGGSLIVVVDIGGTSADICLLQAGEAALTQRGRAGAWPLPIVDTAAIGASGSSIARVEDGALLVGHISAGSRPGPACYGAGARRRPDRCSRPSCSPRATSAFAKARCLARLKSTATPAPLQP